MMSVPPPVRLDIPGNDGVAIEGRVGVHTGPCNGIHSHSCSASEGNTQTTEGTCSKFTADGKTSSRPWRKSARECIAERRHAAAVLGGESTISTRCVHRVMEVQELIDGMGGDAPDALQASVTELLQAATNNRPEPEVADARSRMESVLAQLGLVEAAAQRALRQTEASRSAVTKLQLMHQVMPRLWVGGWAALNNDCAALRVRRVTHVVSLVSGEKRRLPKFILGHHYVQVDDREQAASIMASHFPQIVLFIDEARNRGGVVYVHCGAGISRAPTGAHSGVSLPVYEHRLEYMCQSIACALSVAHAAAAYLVWKLGLSASDALALVRSNRSCARPNVGFVSSLKQWAAMPHASADVADPTRAHDFLTARRASEQQQHHAPQCSHSVQFSASTNERTDQPMRGVGDDQPGTWERDAGCGSCGGARGSG